MPKPQKTEAELEEIILEATGIEVVVIPSSEVGWTATILVGMDKGQTLVDAALPALRARYDLKSD
jgi:hypothetical protein